MIPFSLWALLFTGIFCLARSAADLRARRFLWGGLGLLAGAATLIVPIPTHAVKVDIPLAAK
ncbi:MAG TPA: hypothetical protein VNR91_05030 [Sphingomonas sp.]|nr:hypothetical protein [Sphingomonas sp.]